MNNVTDMLKLKKQSKFRFVLSLIVVALLFILMAAGDVLLIVLSPEKFIVNLILAIIVSVIVVWAIIFYFSMMYTQLRYMYEISKKYSKFNESEGYFTVIEEKEITKNKVTFKALKVSYVDGGATYTRDLLLLDDVSLEKDTKIKAKIYQNFLTGYEVIKNENN